MAEPIEFHRLFYTPVWRYQYPEIDRDFDKLADYFTRDEIYLSEAERNGLQITKAGLHKDPALKDLTDWIQDCCESSMTRMGFEKNCGITSMWATRQRAGGFHHSHHHANSFLGGVMHLFDSDQCASGTVFENTECSKYVIRPTEKGLPMLAYDEHLPFIPGTMLVFPAWAQHTTIPTQSRYRVVVAFNSMPVGMTDSDHFDRYNYPDPSGLKLKEYAG